MKMLANFGLVLAMAACQPQAERSASVVTDAVLVRQNASQVQEDAVRSLLAGTWDCAGVASGINISSQTDFKRDGGLQAALHMASDDLDLRIDLTGRWVLKGFNLQQTFTSGGEISGSLNGEPITSEAGGQLKAAILELSPDPEAINISDHKFTLTDGEGTVTTCTR